MKIASRYMNSLLKTAVAVLTALALGQHTAVLKLDSEHPLVLLVAVLIVKAACDYCGIKVESSVEKGTNGNGKGDRPSP